MFVKTQVSLVWPAVLSRGEDICFQMLTDPPRGEDARHQQLFSLEEFEKLHEDIGKVIKTYKWLAASASSK